MLYEALDDKVKIHKWVGVHGIRWIASVNRCIKAFLCNVTAAAADVHRWAMLTIKFDLSLCSPSSDFLNCVVQKTFSAGSNILDRHGNVTDKVLTRGKQYSGVVTEICPPDKTVLEKNEHSGDFFKITYGRDDSEQVTKGELLSLLNKVHLPELEKVDDKGNYKNFHWSLFNRLTSYMPIAVAHFMSDVHHKTKGLSEVMQKNGVPLADVDSKVHETCNELKLLLQIPGSVWSKFQSQFSQKDNTWLGLLLHDYDEEKIENFQQNVVMRTISSIQARFDDKEPLFITMKVIETRHWPIGNIVVGPDTIDESSIFGKYGNAEIKKLATHYHELLASLEIDGNKDPALETVVTMVVADWMRLKNDIVMGNVGIEKVRHEPYAVFWAFMSRHYRTRYPWFLFVVAIIRLVPAGSAECERVFSAMNRLKTDMRNRMSNERLDDLLAVNRLAPELNDISDTLLDELISHWSSTGRATRYFS